MQIALLLTRRAREQATERKSIFKKIVVEKMNSYQETKAIKLMSGRGENDNNNC
jgi:hypothetical protein